MSDTWQAPSRKLGRLPSRQDRRTLQLANYVDLAKLPLIPAESDWTKPVSVWGTLGNNAYGDCVFAAKAHMIHGWTANMGKPDPVPEKEVIDLYLKYSPGDDGYNIMESLDIMRKVGLWSHKLWAYTAIDLHNHDMVKAAIHLFGCIDTGVNLPRGWQSAEVWDIGAGRPGSWGGHDVAIMKYDSTGVWCITWGNVQKITWAGLDYYFDEGYACISPDWIAPGGTAPNGFDLTTLHHDLQAVTS